MLSLENQNNKAKTNWFDFSEVFDNSSFDDFK